MSYTPPTAGTANWDVPLNQALADINTLAEDALAGGAATVAAAEQQAYAGPGAFFNLATVGPTVSVTLHKPRTVLVLFKASMFQVSTTDAVYMSFSASGATTFSANTSAAAVQNGSGNAEAFSAFTRLACNAGTTTFTAKYFVAGGTGQWSNRELAVAVLR